MGGSCAFAGGGFFYAMVFSFNFLFFSGARRGVWTGWEGRLVGWLGGQVGRLVGRVGRLVGWLGR